MVAFAKFFGEDGQPANSFDHKSAAAELVAHFEDFWQKCLAHSAEAKSKEAMQSVSDVIRAIEARVITDAAMIELLTTDGS